MLKLWAAGMIIIAVLGAGGSMVLADGSVCVGDCDVSGSVTVDDLVKGVNVALGTVELEVCPALDASGDGEVSIDELIQAVARALDGCPVFVATAGTVFGAEANRLHAYQGVAGFPRQTVIPSDNDAPGEGRDINGQICFTRGPDNQLRFIAGEDTGQGPSHATAGWGLFNLDGSFPDFAWEQIGKMTPTYQDGDEAENYGCGFLPDGRLLTTDVGNQAAGPGTGQLIVWFPPLDAEDVRYCKLDIGIGTAQQIAVDGEVVYVASSRASGANGTGIYRYTGAFPTSDTADGGCGLTDPTGAPMVDAGRVTKERFIPGDGNIQTPGGIVRIPGGGFYIASVINGVIAEYDADGTFVRRVLSPPRPGVPAVTGNPIGLGLASDGTLYFADIGLALGGGGIGPGRNLGTVRRIRFVAGTPQPPEIMNQGLNFPDGIGVIEMDAEETRNPG
jgi:hypothetical protein